MEAVIREIRESVSSGLEEMREDLVTTTGELRGTLGIKIDGTIGDLRNELELLQKSNILGIRTVYRNRGEALREFAKHLREEKDEIAIVGSSFLGIIRFVDEEGNTTREILQGRLKAGCKLKFLLTHPSYSHFREGQEGRIEGAISREIEETLFIFVRELNFPPECIKLYKGTPTCFLVITPKWMLVNPYPYETEAFNSFCLEVENKGRGSIYHHYFEFHFKKPWEGENAVPYVEYEKNARAFDALKNMVSTVDDPLFRSFLHRLSPEPTKASEVFLYGLANVLASKGELERGEIQKFGKREYCSFTNVTTGEIFFVTKPELERETERQLEQDIRGILERAHKSGAKGST